MADIATIEYQADSIPPDGLLIVGGNVSATNVEIEMRWLPKIGDLGNSGRIFRAHYDGEQIQDFQTDVINHMLANASTSGPITEDDITASVYCPAGPVRGGVAKVTNANYSLHESPRVRLFNDYVIEAIRIGMRIDAGDRLNDFSVPLPHADGSYGIEDLTEAIGAVCGAGTGFGGAFMRYDQSRCRHYAEPSEPGHVRLATRDDQHDRLRDFIAESKGIDIVKVEDELSGSGYVLTGEFFVKEDSSVQRTSTSVGLFMNEDDVAQRAMLMDKVARRDPFGNTPLGAAAKHWWLTYGSEFHDMAVLATADMMWVSGGIFRKNIYTSDEIGSESIDPRVYGPLMEELVRDRAHNAWLSNINARGVINKDTNLEGALAIAARPEYLEQPKED